MNKKGIFFQYCMLIVFFNDCLVVSLFDIVGDIKNETCSLWAKLQFFSNDYQIL